MKHVRILLILMSFIMASCGDNELARSADGLWYSKLNLKDEYGVPYTVEEYLRLIYEESNEKDGGTFVESIVSHNIDDDGEYQVTYDVHSTVSGEWEVLFGDFISVYDLYSLEIEIKNLKFLPSESADIISRLDFASDDIWSLTLEKESIREEIRRGIYQQVLSDYRRHNYEVDNENGCFSDFQVNGDILSFTASDISMKMKRVKE